MTVHDAAVIGSVVGSIAFTVMAGQSAPKLYAACSSLHIKPVPQVEWCAVFSEKLVEDVEVDLI